MNRKPEYNRRKQQNHRDVDRQQQLPLTLPSHLSHDCLNRLLYLPFCHASSLTGSLLPRNSPSTDAAAIITPVPLAGINNYAMPHCPQLRHRPLSPIYHPFR